MNNILNVRTSEAIRIYNLNKLWDLYLIEWSRSIDWNEHPYCSYNLLFHGNICHKYLYFLDSFNLRKLIYHQHFRKDSHLFPSLLVSDPMFAFNQITLDALLTLGLVFSPSLKMFFPKLLFEMFTFFFSKASCRILYYSSKLLFI